MDTTTDSTQRFLADIAEVRVKNAGRDTVFLRLGAAMMPIGIGGTIVAYFLSYGTENPLEQRDAQIVAVIGLAIAVVGAALFLRYSLAEFLRFWMARLLHHQGPQGSVDVPSARMKEND